MEYKEKAIRGIVASYVKAYAAGSCDRHVSEKDDEDGVINMKIHNPFIAALGVNSTSKCNITHNICKTPASVLKSSIFPWSSVYFFCIIATFAPRLIVYTLQYKDN